MSLDFFAPREWKPATPEDAAAIARDYATGGIAFATPDGRRIDPRDVRTETALEIEPRYLPHAPRPSR